MKIFISYSTKDEQRVRGLEKYISKEMVQTWIDHKAISGGSSLIKTITKGIDNSDVYFLFISQNSLNSDWVKKEIKLAIKKEEKLKYEFIVPVVLDIKAWKNWNQKKLKDRKFVSYNENIHRMAHDIKDTIVNKTIEKFEHACFLKKHFIEKFKIAIVMILCTLAYFTTPTQEEHSKHLEEASSSCYQSNIKFEDMWLVSYATCSINEQKRLSSFGAFNMMFFRETQHR